MLSVPERHDEVGQPQLGDQHAVEGTADEADQQAGADPREQTVRQHVGGDHARQADDRADRQVDALGHDDQRHADGDHRVDRGLEHDVDQVRRLIEGAR